MENLSTTKSIADRPDFPDHKLALADISFDQLQHDFFSRYSIQILPKIASMLR